MRSFRAIRRRLEAEELRLLRDESRAALAEVRRSSSYSSRSRRFPIGDFSSCELIPQVEQQLVALHERKADAEKVERALDEKVHTTRMPK